MRRQPINRTIDPRQGHQRAALDQFGVTTTADVARNLDEREGAFRGSSAHLPRITGNWGDGSAAASTASVLAELGLAINDTDGNDAIDTIGLSHIVQAIVKGGLAGALVVAVSHSNTDFTNTNTATNADADTVTIDLPTGTWTLYAVGGGTFTHSTTGMTSRVVLVLDGTSGGNADGGGLAGTTTSKGTAIAASSKPLVAGDTTVTCAVTFRSTVAGTITCEVSWIAVIAVRTA